MGTDTVSTGSFERLSAFSYGPDELHRKLTKVTQRLLRELEADGFIIREGYAEMQPTLHKKLRRFIIASHSCGMSIPFSHLQATIFPDLGSREKDLS